MTIANIKEPRHDSAETNTTTVPSPSVLTAIDPATGQTIGTVAITPEARVPEIVARARAA